jgi:hypothetical protein
MRFTTEYGHLIKALRDYPFTQQIKDRHQEIECSARPDDVNASIKGKGKLHTPKVLLDMIKKESDPILHKYELYKEAIELIKGQTTFNEWAVIRDIYVHRNKTVDGAAYHYFNAGKDYAYKNIIKPFFRNLDTAIFELSVAKKISFDISKT